MDYERRNPRNMIFEYMVPSSVWTENSDSHCLLIDLPGFKNEEVRIRADKYGHVIVSGDRQANDNKIIHFEQSFKVPEGCNIEDTSAILANEIYYVTIPKNVTPEKEVQNSTFLQEKDEIENNVINGNNHDYNQENQETSQEEEEEDENEETSQEEEEEEEEEEYHSTASADEWSESSLLKKISKNLKKNRCIVLTALLAFSLGIVVSHRYQSTAQVEKSQ